MDQAEIKLERLSVHNLHPFTELTLELWPDGAYEEALVECKQMIDAPDNYCALATYHEQYVGFIHISIRSDYVEGATNNKTAYLEGIYIKPAYRRNNIGMFLLNHGQQWAKLKGLDQIASDTELDNLSGQQFHEKLGFTKTNSIVCYLKNI